MQLTLRMRPPEPAATLEARLAAMVVAPTDAALCADDLDAAWTVCVLSIASDGRALLATRLRRGAEPLTVLLPFARETGMLATPITASAAVDEFRAIRVRCLPSRFHRPHGRILIRVSVGAGGQSRTAPISLRAAPKHCALTSAVAGGRSAAPTTTSCGSFWKRSRASGLAVSRYIPRFPA